MVCPDNREGTAANPKRAYARDGAQRLRRCERCGRHRPAFGLERALKLADFQHMRTSGNPSIHTNGLARLASIALVWVILIAVGRAVRPQDSSASVALSRAGASAATRSYGTEHKDYIEHGAVVGTLSGRSYIVTLRTTPEGARYDVADLNGVTVARMLDGKALAATFPQIDVQALTASPHGTPVMSADGPHGSDDR